MTTKRHTRQLLTAVILLHSLTLTTSITFPLILQAETQETRDVTIQDLTFQPQNITITKGDTVNWTNNDLVIYTLWFTYKENESTYLLSDPIPPGASWSRVFNDPAKLKYYCFERLWITGNLRIVMVLGDVNWDNIVDIYDLHALGRAYQATRESPNWNEDADINFDNTVNKTDLTTLSNNYGKTDP